jgi:hypothetical protein
VISALAAPPETAPPDPTDIRTRPKKNPCLSKGSGKISQRASPGYHSPGCYELHCSPRITHAHSASKRDSA